MVLRSVGVLSCGKVLGSVYALLGLLIGMFFTLMSAFGVALNQQANAPQGVVPIALGAGAIILLPILYGIGGFIGGVVVGLLYNVVAGLVGGLELEFESLAMRSTYDDAELTHPS